MSTQDGKDDMTTPLRNYERHSSYTFNRGDGDFPVPNTLTPLEKLEIDYPENIGTYYLIASAIFMSLNALFVKFSSHLPVYELIFIRAIMTFALSWVYISKFSPDLNIDDRKNKKFILYLSLLGFLVAVTYVYGIFTLDLSEAISVLFTTPMWIGLLSWVVLGQKLKQYEIYCVGVIAFGVLCIMRPDFDDSDDTAEQVAINQSRFHGTIACVIHSFFNACTTLVVRIMNTKVHPLVIMLLSTVINFCISGVNLIFSGWVSPDFGQWINLVIMTVLFFGGQFFLMKGLQKADKTAYSPVILNYLQLPLAYIFDMFILGTMPLVWSLIGTALIIAGCITIVRVR